MEKQTPNLVYVVEFIKHHIRTEKTHLILDRWVIYNFDTKQCTIQEATNDSPLTTMLYEIFQGNTTMFCSQDIIDTLKRQMDERYDF